ncbi:MAG: iron-sulfur cluster assembly scaffold protein [Candidatus Nanoarchaeia archaeon]
MVENWAYTDVLKEHFFNPKNFLKSQKEVQEFSKKANGYGIAGNPVCGDVMEIWLKIENNRIKEFKWRTYGCAAAIAVTSMLSIMLTENSGMSIDDARLLTPQKIISKLVALPSAKVHCAVLGNQALQVALNYYFRKNSQFDKIVPLAGKILDEKLKITEKEIEDLIKSGVKEIKQLEEKIGAKIEDQKTIQKIKNILKKYGK